MLPDELYTKGVPDLDEAILAEDYATIEGESLDDVVDAIISHQVLGVLHRGIWYIEAPPFCEEKLRDLHARKRDQNRATNEGQERRHYEREQDQQRQTQVDFPDTDLDRAHGKILGLKGKVTREDVKNRWRELSQQYHPDKVQHLGPKLKVLAEQEMKAINAAYQHFRSKYEI